MNSKTKALTRAKQHNEAMKYKKAKNDRHERIESIKRINSRPLGNGLVMSGDKLKK